MTTFDDFTVPFQDGAFMRWFISADDTTVTALDAGTNCFFR